MAKRNSIIFSLLVLPILLQAQHNFGFSIGLKEYFAENIYVGRYQDMDFYLGYNNDYIYIPLGIFYEYDFPNINYFTLASSLTINDHFFLVNTYDYDPPAFPQFTPALHVGTAAYRPYILSIVPSLVVKRGVQLRLGLGYSLNFMHPLKNKGTLSRWQPSNPNQVKAKAFMRDFIKANPIRTFTHHVVLNAEVRFWRLGIEARYLRSLHSVYRSINFRDEFIIPFRSNSSEITVSLKLYLKKLKKWDDALIEKQ